MLVRRALFCVLVIFFVVQVFIVKADREEYNTIKEQEAMAYKLFSSGRIEESVEWYIKVLSQYSPDMNIHEKRECAKAFNNLGYIRLVNHHNPIAAYPFLLKAKEIAEENGQFDLLGAIYGNVAKLYDDFDDVSTALGYYKAGLQSSVKQKSDVTHVIELMAFTDIANFAIQRNLIDSISDAIEIFKNHPIKNIPNSYYSTQLARALELSINGDNLAAFKTLLNATDKIDSTVNYKRDLTFHNFALATFQKRAHNLSKAIEYLEIAREIVEDPDLADLRPRVLNELSIIYKQSGNTQFSDRYRLLALEVSDSLYSAKNFGKIHDLEISTKLDNLNKDIQIANYEVRMKRLYIWLLIIAIVLILSLSTGLLLHTRRLRRRQIELVEAHRDAVSKREAEASMRMHYKQEIERLSQENKELQNKSLENQSKDLENNLISKPGRPSPRKVPGDEKQHLQIIDSINDVLSKREIFCDPDFSLERLARIVGSKPPYVSAIINEKMGTSFSSLLSQARVAESRKLLLDEDINSRLSIEAIAGAVGYKSRTYFISIFKKITGLTPTQYIKASKKVV